MRNASHELFNGAPGTMLAALHVYEATGAERWRDYGSGALTRCGSSSASTQSSATGSGFSTAMVGCCAVSAPVMGSRPTSARCCVVRAYSAEPGSMSSSRRPARPCEGSPWMRMAWSTGRRPRTAIGPSSSRSVCSGATALRGCSLACGRCLARNALTISYAAPEISSGRPDRSRRARACATGPRQRLRVPRPARAIR